MFTGRFSVFYIEYCISYKFELLPFTGCHYARIHQFSVLLTTFCFDVCPRAASSRTAAQYGPSQKSDNDEEYRGDKRDDKPQNCSGRGILLIILSILCQYLEFLLFRTNGQILPMNWPIGWLLKLWLFWHDLYFSVEYFELSGFCL